MPSESERIANLGIGNRLLVFGFWTGKLPDISRLHFMTIARALPAESRYILFVYEACISSSMLTLLGRCGIEVLAINLPRLMRDCGLKLLRQTPLSATWELVQKVLIKRAHLAKPFGLGHYHQSHPIRGFTPRYNILLGAPPITGPTISDYMRVLVSSLMKTHTLYVDLDFAFTRPLDWICEHGSFVYRWEHRPLANSALMSVREESPIKGGTLIGLLKSEGTGKPWILFSEENCRACGLEILSCDRLDPLWSQANPSGPHFAEFSEETLQSLKREFDAIHWHNRWSEVPEPGSPYDLWLRELSAIPTPPPIDARSGKAVRHARARSSSTEF
jgi:hypothetical protein